MPINHECFADNLRHSLAPLYKPLTLTDAELKYGLGQPFHFIDSHTTNDRPLHDQDYDFVYPLNISEDGKISIFDIMSFNFLYQPKLYKK